MKLFSFLLIFINTLTVKNLRTAQLMGTNETIQIKKIVFSEAEKEFHQECLQAHNKYRSKHGSPPLVLCDQLCSYATNWAYELAELDQLVYSPTNSLGENLYMAAGIRIDGTSPVKAWYNEESDYDYKKSKFSPYTGHFTQVIWKASRELGVGVVRTEKSYIVVASYYPAGNEKDAFKANVLPLKNFNNQNQDSDGSDGKNCLICAGILFATVIVGAWIIYKL